jgi:hypothetical protein
MTLNNLLSPLENLSKNEQLTQTVKSAGHNTVLLFGGVMDNAALGKRKDHEWYWPECPFLLLSRKATQSFPALSLQ